MLFIQGPQRRVRIARLIRNMVAPALLFLTVLSIPTVVRADTNESAPSNPNAAMSGLLTVGSYNTCYVLESTAVKCWGYNNGNVGNGTFDDATIPQDVIGLTGVTAISTGQTVCAVTTTGGLKCWGEARGNGSMNQTATAADMPGMTSGVAMVSAGNGTVCAVMTDGALKCWGRNMQGNLGDGTTTDSLTPVQVSGLSSGVASVSVGDQHVCALTTAGGVLCWGRGPAGQVGDNSNSPNDRLTPVPVIGLSGSAVAVSAGQEFSCALLATGAVECWGRGDKGQMGNGSNQYSNLVPTQVTGLSSGVVAISAGSIHACALMSTGAVKCWGNNSSGELGDGTTTDSNVPVDVIGLESPVKAVATGDGSTCVLVVVNDVRCFGANYYGEHGNGTTDSSSTPVKVLGLPPVGSPNLPATGSTTGSTLAWALGMLTLGVAIVLRRRAAH